MKGSAICLLFLWQAAVGASTNAQYYFDKGGNGDDHGEPNRPQTDLAPGVETNIPLQPGAEHVDSALFELKKVPRLPYKNRRQTGGLISALGRLILKTLPTTPARGPAQQRQPTKASGEIDWALVTGNTTLANPPATKESEAGEEKKEEKAEKAEKAESKPEQKTEQKAAPKKAVGKENIDFDDEIGSDDEAAMREALTAAEEK